MSLNEIVDVITKSQSIVIATHIFPDGDALGSQLGLGEILKSLGKKVCLYSEEPASHLLDFMPGCAQLVTTLPETSQFDCGIALDCGDELRLGMIREKICTIDPFVTIDHHSGHKDFGTLRWVDANLSSTGEMICELAKALGAELNYNAAYCLYTAIVSDTGSFKYASTSAQTLKLAGELIAQGVKPAEVAGKIFDNYSKNRLQLLQHVLATLKLYGDDQIAMISVTENMFELTGTSALDTEMFINYPRSLGTVKVAAFLKEADEDTIRVSLRSKGKYDVAKIARKYQGGGHRNAAGLKLADMTIDDARKLLMKELLPLVEES